VIALSHFGMLWQRAWLVSELQHGGRPVDLSTPQPDFNGEQDASSGGGVGGLDRDVRRARLAHAAHFDALVEIRDAQTLRLAALQDVLLKKMAEDPRLKNLLPLQLETGFPPRLWLDNISYIIMEPDPRTFRLVRQAREGHLKIAETRDMSQMFREVRAYASHRLVETERDAAASTDSNANGAARTTSQLLMIWLAGFTFGVLSLLLTGVMLGKVSF
jgi:hypothetical protein